INPGDTLLAVNDTSYTPPEMPPFHLGQAYRLRVSSLKGDSAREIIIDIPNRKGTKARPPIIEPKGLTYAAVAPNVGLLKIRYFPGEIGMRFSKDLDTAISDLKKQGTDRLIVDLRGNIGG